MNSIRRKLFIQIGSIVVLFILLLYLANTFLLETFYVESSKTRLIHIYDQVNTMKAKDYDPGRLFRLVADNRNFVELSIIDEANRLVYLPSNPMFEYESRRPTPKNFQKPSINKGQIQKTEVIDDQTQFIWVIDEETQASFFTLTGELDNGNKIDIRVSLASISENVKFFNRFIIAAGIIILVITTIAANLIAKNFTTPILEMFEVTDSIKRLEFSNKCRITSNDELGQLGENINEMSYVLEDTINNLGNSNQQLSEEVEERLRIDEQRKTLLNNVSHELKTPLSLVQGYSEGVKVNLNKNPAKTEVYCDIIIDEAKKMDALVSQLLDINRIQFGDFPLHKESTKGADFIDYIIRKYEPTIEASDIVFSTDLSIEPLMLHIDALRTEQVLTNLISNALAYVDERRELTIKAFLVSDHLRIEVANSFKKVEESELNNWWNSFYKADQARTRDNGGYGLGLSIIKAIQEADNNAYGVYYEDGFIHFFVDLDTV